MMMNTLVRSELGDLAWRKLWIYEYSESILHQIITEKQNSRSAEAVQWFNTEKMIRAV